MKYIIITGGVISGIGKGITASSIGLLLKHCGYNVTAIKIDPYINLDAGTMSPFEHGECYVLEDGGETDLDLGNYERFLNIQLTSDHNITTGKVYKSVIDLERKGEYLGKTVQIVPHITNHIKSIISNISHTKVDNSSNPDVCLIELGGTIGDIESMPFIEALRQFIFENPNDTCLLHVSLLPLITSGELKTKPTQHSIKTLRSLGINPDFLCLRTSKPVSREIIKKINTSCQIYEDNIFINENISHIYQVPLLFKKQNIHLKILQKLHLTPYNCNLIQWNLLNTHFDSISNPLQIAIVGKYTGLSDSYLSLTRSLEFSSFLCKKYIDIYFIDAENIDKIKLHRANGIIIPGGFGERGSEGKIDCCKYARENKIPLLGICLGMQIMAIEFARNILNLSNANSTEFYKNTEHPIVSDMSVYNTKQKGGTMRLGLKIININTNISKFYFDKTIQERHRHRYEINPDYYYYLEQHGLNITGKCSDNKYAEIIEYHNHPFYVGCQFHPEYNYPNPIFQHFLNKIDLK